jgi:drug/metabolite transporter (DMT)-like permease
LNIYLVIFITLVAAFIAALAQIIFKKNIKGEIKSVKGIIKLAKNQMVVIGLFMYLISLVVYLYALHDAPLSFVYPTFASTFIFVFILSGILLKEKYPVHRLIGVVLIFIGIIIVGISL